MVAGDVLVTTMTTPSLMLAVEKAGAIVTDEGGMLCHAADASISNIKARTGMTEAQAREALEKTSPQRRLIEADEVAAVAVFLAQESSRGITGQAINIDGGSVMS